MLPLHIQELLKKVLVSDMSKPAAFYLYTTPPKQVCHHACLDRFVPWVCCMHA